MLEEILKNNNLKILRNKIVLTKERKEFKEVEVQSKYGIKDTMFTVEDEDKNLYDQMIPKLGDFITETDSEINNHNMGEIIERKDSFYPHSKYEYIIKTPTGKEVTIFSSCCYVLTEETFVFIRDFYNNKPVPEAKVIKKEIDYIIDSSIFSTTKDKKTLKLGYKRFEPQNIKYDCLGRKKPDPGSKVNILILRDGTMLRQYCLSLDEDWKINKDYLPENKHKFVLKDVDDYLILTDKELKIFKNHYNIGE
jgi:hypothetical protein